MSEVNDKLLADIKRLEREINEREIYFYKKLEPKLMKLLNKVSVQHFFIHFHESYKLRRLKIIFTRFKGPKGRRRRSNTIRRVVIRYKYRTVLHFEYDDYTTKSELKIFHPCDWLIHFNTLCEEIPQVIQEEYYKDELKRLKKRQKKLKKKCESFKVLCDE